MAYFLQQNVVEYACSCGILKPITKIYFCRHCLKVRCGFCVCHEVDSHYCANCLENIPSTEARLKKNLCASCFDCPSCFHTLSTRATVQNAVKTEGGKEKDVKPITRKIYYFGCLSCRWTSRDVGMPDQTVASGSWPERDNVYANRISTLQEYFTALVLREKQEKMESNRKKYIAKGKYTNLTDLTGLTASMIRKKVGLPDLNPNSSSLQTLKPIPPALASEEVDQLPADIFTKPLNLMNVTTLPQRLIQPENQAVNVNKLFPQHKSLTIKQSLRCRQCEHNVIKPEYNPGSIKFKIHLFAYYHIPEVRFVTCEPLRAGKPSSLIIKLSNPTPHETTITLLPLSFEIPKDIPSADQGNSSEETSSVGLSRQSSISIVEEPRTLSIMVNGDIELPESCIILPHRDDAAEYDDDIQVYQDDPNLIVWRRSNKVGLKFIVTPHENLSMSENVKIGFIVKYSYINTISTPEKQKHELYSKVFIAIGKILGTN